MHHNLDYRVFDIERIRNNLLKLAADGLAGAIDVEGRMDSGATDLFAEFAIAGQNNEIFAQFIRSGLQLGIEKAREIRAQLPLVNFIIDKFTNNKFPRDWDMLPQDDLAEAIIKYLALDEEREEKIQKLLGNGLKSYSSYQELSAILNARLEGEVFLPITSEEKLLLSQQRELGEILGVDLTAPDFSTRVREANPVVAKLEARFRSINS